MKFLIINNKFSDFVDELIKDIAVWVYEKNQLRNETHKLCEDYY